MNEGLANLMERLWHARGMTFLNFRTPFFLSLELLFFCVLSSYDCFLVGWLDFIEILLKLLLWKQLRKRLANLSRRAYKVMRPWAPSPTTSNFGNVLRSLITMKGYCHCCTGSPRSALCGRIPPPPIGHHWVGSAFSHDHLRAFIN